MCEKKQTTTEVQFDTVACRTCREPIKIGAKKCTECDSYQDWTRYLFQWGGVLILLIGIAPIWEIARSLHTIAFSSKAANVEAVIINCAQDKIDIAFTNSGKLDGIVTGVDFVIVENNIRRKAAFEVHPDGKSSYIIVSPEKPPEIVNYRAYIDKTETSFVTQTQTSKSCSYLIEIDWCDFKGTKRKIYREYLCPQ